MESTVEITEVFATRPATDEDIRRLESQIGATLPADYREFILKNNGGRPDYDYIAFSTPEGDLQDTDVLAFLSLDENDRHYNVFRFLQAYKGRIPRSCLPVACDSGGNLMLLDLA